MTLQELLDHALARQWFAASYGTPTKSGPLQTYVKKYAAALGHETRRCPPKVYHLPDERVRDTLFDAADDDVPPRSVQACVNAILKLLHRAVAEGGLPSLQAPLIRRGSLHRQRTLRPYIKGDDRAARCYAVRYGLTQWPFDLAYEMAMYLQWCTPAVQRGRPVHLRKGPSAQARVANTIGQVAGYAVDVRGEEKATLTLRALCEPTLLEDFAWWWISERRGINTRGLTKGLGIMQTIARHWFKEEGLAVAIGDVVGQLCQEAPPQRTLDKEGREFSLEELDRLARSCHPLNEQRLKESARARLIARHMADPVAHPLPPSHRRHQAATNGTYSMAYLAVRVELSLIIGLLIHRPLRIGNICNLQFKHLQPQPGGGYEMVIPKSEMKNGKFMDRKEWRERFPTRLLLLLHEWLEVWRPRLLIPETSDPEHPRAPRYRRMETQRREDQQRYVFLNAWGLQYNRGKLSDSIKREMVRLTMDRPGGPVAWFPHNIRTTWTKEMLHAGLNPYVVKRILGDSFKVIDKHYGGYQDGQPSAFARQLAKEIGEGID
jgi:hypothetical protein